MQRTHIAFDEFSSRKRDLKNFRLIRICSWWVLIYVLRHAKSFRVELLELIISFHFAKYYKQFLVFIIAPQQMFECYFSRYVLQM